MDKDLKKKLLYAMELCSSGGATYVDSMLNNVYIFGAGANGRWVYKVLKEKGIKPLGFIDENCKLDKINDLPVYVPEILKSKNDNTVIVAFFIKDMDVRRNIIKMLVKNGAVEEKICFALELFINEYFNKKMILSNMDKVLKAFELFNDEKSLWTYYKFFFAIAKNNWREFILPDKGQQYFPDDILRDDTLLRVVDCGAYIGDTFEQLMNYKNFKSYIGFEPDFNNFNLLCHKLLEKESINGGTWIAYPCGTYSDNKKIKFISSNTSYSSPGGGISEDGDSLVTFVSLDKTIRNWHPTFIKMDVEGSESNCILGAKQIIENDHPDLAICVYHQTKDIWEIPLLINSIYPYYKFYLRTYYLHAREMVLYAINK